MIALGRGFVSLPVTGDFPIGLEGRRSVRIASGLYPTGGVDHANALQHVLAGGVGDGAHDPMCRPVQGTRDTTTYRRIKAQLDAIPAIDTHDHLPPFDLISGG